MSLPSVALGDVAEFIRGVTYKPADLVENFSDGSVVCMRTANVQRELQQSDLLSIPRELVKSENKMLREGDLLVSTANSWNLVGKCCWVPALSYPAAAGGFIAVLRGKPEKVDLRYLYHWFSSPDTQADARNCGRQTTNISNMDIGRCLALRIPLPSLAEQRRIAATLDKADALRAKRREAIAKLDQLLQSVFLDMFGDASDTNATVEELSAADGAIRTGPFGSQLLHSEFVDSGVAVLGIDNVVSNKFVWAKPRFITEQKYAALARYTVSPGDVLITIMGTCGRCAVVPEDVPTAINTKHLCCISLDKKRCEPEFLHSYFLMHPQAKSYLEGRAKGAIMSGLNMGIIKEMPVALPPIERQREFVSIKAALRLEQAQMVDHLSHSNQFFEAIQQQAFAGTL